LHLQEKERFVQYNQRAIANCRAALCDVFVRGIALLLIYSLSDYSVCFAGTPAAMADVRSFGGRDDDLQPREIYQKAEEFYSEAQPGEILIPVKVIGAIPRAGIYHIPKVTDLMQLIALAGGVRQDAEISEIVVRRDRDNKKEVIRFDLKKFLDGDDGLLIPTLEPQDVVMVYPKEPIFSQNSITFISFVASIVSLVVSGVMISKANSN
jgi:hypothetical protein